MTRLREIARFVAVLLASVGSEACFTEEPPSCPRGDRGCRCLEGLCEDGFVCSDRDFCLLEDCTPGEVYCSCDDGMCVGMIECIEDAVCRPEEPVEVSDTEASGSGSGTSMSTSASTSDDPTSGPTDCTPGEACGPCRRCDDDGECEVEVGIACDGPTLQCADYLWGLMGGACRLKAAAELGARCDAFGECRQAALQDCPTEMGEVHISCQPACLDAPGNCAADAPAATVTVSSMCAEAGPGPDCMPICFNGSYSEITHYACTDGECLNVPMLDVDCGLYRCEDGACNTSCTGDLDCAMSYFCDTMTETCYLP